MNFYPFGLMEILLRKINATGMVRQVPFAGVAQLVEHNVANVVVVGSNPIARFSV